MLTVCQCIPVHAVWMFKIGPCTAGAAGMEGGGVCGGVVEGGRSRLQASSCLQTLIPKLACVVVMLHVVSSWTDSCRTML